MGSEQGSMMSKGGMMSRSQERSMVSNGSSMDQRSSMGVGSDQRSSVMFIDGNKRSEARLVDQGSCRVFGFNSRFVGLDVCSVSKGVSNVVNDSESSVSISQSIRTNFVSMSISSLSSEGSSSCVILVVSEGIVSNVLIHLKEY
jgi:hypothetical protein